MLWGKGLGKRMRGKVQWEIGEGGCYGERGCGKG